MTTATISGTLTDAVAGGPTKLKRIAADGGDSNIARASNGSVGVSDTFALGESAALLVEQNGTGSFSGSVSVDNTSGSGAVKLVSYPAASGSSELLSVAAGASGSTSVSMSATGDRVALEAA